MRILSCLTATGLAATLLTAPAAIAGPDEELKGAAVPARMDGHQPDSYRYGQLLRVDPAADPEACEQACTDTSGCMSWSLVTLAPDTPARCELKRNIGNAISRPGAVSGIATRFHPIAIPLPGDAEADDLPDAPSLKSQPAKSHIPAQSEIRAKSEIPTKPAAPTNTGGGSSAAPIIYRPGGSNLDGGPLVSGRTTITSGSNSTPIVIKPGKNTGPNVITPEN